MYLKCKISNKGVDYSQYEDLPTLPIFDNAILENALGDQLFETLDGHIYQKNLVIVEGNALFKLAIKLWRQAEDVLTESSSNCNIEFIRMQITNLLICGYQYVVNYKELAKELLNNLKLFKKSMLRLGELEDNSLNKLISGNISVENDQVSQYFHMYLCVNRLILLIESACDSRLSTVELTVQCIMKDLVTLAYKIHQKNKMSDILQIQPYPCYCVKQFWWHIIWFFHINDGNGDRYWKIYKEAINAADEEFNLWLLYHTSVLQGYDEAGSYTRPLANFTQNHCFIEMHIQSLVSSNVFDNEKTLNVLRVLDPLLTNLWIDSARIEPYQLLWEYFYKNLINSNKRNARLPKTCKEFYETIDCLRTNVKGVTSSYEYFIALLRKHFSFHPQHWPKLRGRIYSRLPPQKIKDFSDDAIYQISILFLTLTHTAVSELVEKLSSLLENLPKERQNSELIWIIYITTVIVCIHENTDIKIASVLLLKLLEEASENRERYHLIKHYVNGLEMIMNLSDNFNLNQSILLGPWIIKYMNSCSQTDLCNLINTLTRTLEKVESSGNCGNLKTAYSSHVLSSLKQVAVSPSAPPQIGRLAALICHVAPEITSDIVQYFCSEQVNVKVINQFLCTLLKDYPITQNIARHQECILIQAWVKCCLLSNDLNSEDLSKKIFSLESIEMTLHIEQGNTQDPLLMFIKALNKQMQLNTNMFRLKELCETAFGHTDLWIRAYLTNSASDPYVLNVYTGISVLFYHCAPLLYHKTKSSCLLNRLVTVLLLPTEVLMGKPPHSNVLKAVERTWHLFVQGIFNLNYTNDAYIERTLKDLIIRYLPHFTPSSSPIIKVFDNSSLALFTLDKISSTFLLRNARSLEENTFKAIKTLQHALEVTYEEERMKLIVQRTLLGVLEVIMFNLQKSAALDFMKYVTSSEWYIHVRDDVRHTLQSVSERHLAFTASSYFQLISVLIKLIPNDVRACLPQIKKQISNVERMRGVGFDNTLRQGLDRIENALSL